VLSGALALAEGGTPVSLPSGGTGRNGGGQGQGGPDAAPRQPAVATGPSAEALPGDAAGLVLEPVQRERAASGRPAVLRVTRRRVLAGLTGVSAVALAGAGWELSQPGTPRRHTANVPSHPANGKKSPQSRPSSVRSTQPGATVWSSGIGGGIFAGLAAADGKLFVATMDGMLYALSAADGSTLWQVGTNGRAVSGPVIVNGTVYVVGGDGALLALSAADGSLLSSVKIPGAAFVNNLPLPSTPVVAGGVVYLVTGTGVFYAINAGAGKTLWTARTRGGFDSGASPCVAGNAVYALSNNQELVALATASGKTSWRATVGGETANGLALTGGIVLVFGKNTLCAMHT
jgi:outer membrane protein assembly factor BamB